MPRPLRARSSESRGGHVVLAILPSRHDRVFEHPALSKGVSPYNLAFAAIPCLLLLALASARAKFSPPFAPAE